MMNCQAEMKKAVDCGYWNLFRFDPSKETGKFQLDSKDPKEGYQAFLMNEARYSRLPQGHFRIFSAPCRRSDKTFKNLDIFEMLCVISSEETAKLHDRNGSQFAKLFHVIADTANGK